MAESEPTITQIKAKIEATGEITRNDVSEILSKKKGQKMSEKKVYVKSILDSLSEEMKKKKSSIDGRLVVDKIVDDLGSYPDV